MGFTIYLMIVIMITETFRYMDVDFNVFQEPERQSNN